MSSCIALHRSASLNGETAPTPWTWNMGVGEMRQEGILFSRLVLSSREQRLHTKDASRLPEPGLGGDATVVARGGPWQVVA